MAGSCHILDNDGKKDRRRAATSLVAARISLVALLTLVAVPWASPQSKNYDYLVRIAHETMSGTACVLLQESGGFHYETGDRENTRVYEGALTAAQLKRIEENLQAISRIWQRDI